jgi:hypothetical protein
MAKTAKVLPAILVPFIVIALFTLMFGSLARGQLSRRGGEFLVNSVTDGDQGAVSVVALPDGGFEALWVLFGVQF